MGLLYEIADELRQHARRRTWTHDRAQGRRGEDIAHRFLQRAGIVVVARNYTMSSGDGEIDLVGWENGTLVFVEVKSRASADYGGPERNVNSDKQRNLIRAARDFALRAAVPWELVRFDIVTVIFGTPPAVTHFRDAFSTTRH
jgi:putative endonuclease